MMSWVLRESNRRVFMARMNRMLICWLYAAPHLRSLLLLAPCCVPCSDAS